MILFVTSLTHGQVGRIMTAEKCSDTELVLCSRVATATPSAALCPDSVWIDRIFFASLNRYWQTLRGSASRIYRRESAQPCFDFRGRLQTQILTVEAGNDLHALGEAVGNMRWNRDGWHAYKTRRSTKQ